MQSGSRGVSLIDLLVLMSALAGAIVVPVCLVRHTGRPLVALLGVPVGVVAGLAAWAVLCMLLCTPFVIGVRLDKRAVLRAGQVDEG